MTNELYQIIIIVIFFILSFVLVIYKVQYDIDTYKIQQQNTIFTDVQTFTPNKFCIKENKLNDLNKEKLIYDIIFKCYVLR